MAKDNYILPKTRQCNTCGLVMAPQGVVQHQRKLNHTGITIIPEPIGVFSCLKCDKTFPTQTGLNMHERRSHSDLQGNPNSLKILRQHVKTRIQSKPKEIETYVKSTHEPIIPIVNDGLAFKPLEDAMLLIDSEGHIWMAERLR